MKQIRNAATDEVPCGHVECPTWGCDVGCELCDRPNEPGARCREHAEWEEVESLDGFRCWESPDGRHFGLVTLGQLDERVVRSHDEPLLDMPTLARVLCGMPRAEGGAR